MDHKNEGKPAFTGTKLTKHFKVSKPTKRMMALFNFPNNVKLSGKEQKDAKVVLTPLTKNDFKNLMIRGQLSVADSKLTGMNDPLWKPKKKETEGSEAVDGVAGTVPGTANKKGGRNKGKKAPKMRNPDVGVTITEKEKV